MIGVRRLNHAVLYVRDAARSTAFYQDVFGFEIVASALDGRMSFLRAAGSENHHDLGLMEVGADAPSPPRGATGLYHLAWQVDDINELATAAKVLSDKGALTGASDHGATKSLYGQDSDGNEFEVMFIVPREAWGEFENAAPILPLDLEAELARWGTKTS